MALRPCKECGHQVSSRAKTCPSCGASLPKNVTVTQAGCLIIVVFFILVASGVFNPRHGLTPNPSGNAASDASGTVSLNADVKFTGTQFVITNNDTFDWPNVKLELNSRGFKSGYILRADRLEAGKKYTVGAMQFAKPDGERYNPVTHKAQQFTIWVEFPDKNGIYVESIQ